MYINLLQTSMQFICMGYDSRNHKYFPYKYNTGFLWVYSIILIINNDNILLYFYKHMLLMICFNCYL